MDLTEHCSSVKGVHTIVLVQKTSVINMIYPVEDFFPYKMLKAADCENGLLN
jgi:hypothetical protein